MSVSRYTEEASRSGQGVCGVQGRHGAMVGDAETVTSQGTEHLKVILVLGESLLVGAELYAMLTHAPCPRIRLGHHMASHGDCFLEDHNYGDYRYISAAK